MPVGVVGSSSTTAIRRTFSQGARDSPAGRAQASSMNAAALSEALSETLAPWEKVRRIVVVDELPTTPTGKPDPLAAAEILMASRH